MNANKTYFHSLVPSNQQYVVPLFQRPYSWTIREWKQLWEDIVDLTEANTFNRPRAEHFIGSMVTMPTVSVPEGVSKYLLIDGQQRMTTLFILMAVLRDKCTEQGDKLAEEINDMIVNRFRSDGDDFFKLMPTQADRNAYKRLILGQASLEEIEGGIVGCYIFFRSKVITRDVRPIFKVISNQLSIVSIVLDPDDNPHVVFESLNAKGRSLSQADLIRNFFFMRVHVNKHERINSDYWQPMQDALGEKMTEFIRHTLMRDGDPVRQGDVYQALRQSVGSNMSEENVIRIMEELAQFATYYCRILFPETYEQYPNIRHYMTRLNVLQFTVAYPFLLNIYHAVKTGQMSDRILLETLRIIENFIFRRAITGTQTNDMNKLFPNLFGWITSGIELDTYPDFLTGLRTELQKRRYPRDNEFRDALLSMPLYAPGERLTRLVYLLKHLETADSHKEAIDLSKCTVEHIFPQNPAIGWKTALAAEYDDMLETWLHTLGNLTLSAYNPELSNHTFEKKRQEYGRSNLRLNRQIAEYNRWTVASVQDRAGRLADAALHVWPDFRVTTQADNISNANVTNTIPYRMTLLGQNYEVTSWVQVFTTTVKALLEIAPEQLPLLMDEFPTWLLTSPGKRSVDLENGSHLNLYASAMNIYRVARQMVEFIGIDPDEWRVDYE